MLAYEVQPKDHIADFDVGRRKVKSVKLLPYGRFSTEPSVVLDVTFDDGHCDGWELEFSMDEWRQLVAFNPDP